MRCPPCGGSGNRRGLDLEASEVDLGGVMWFGALDLCPCCDGAGWVTPSRWREYRATRPVSWNLTHNRAARARREAAA